MKKQIPIQIIHKPHPDAKRDAAIVLDLLAEALADRIVTDARSRAAKREEPREEVAIHEC